MTETTDQQDGPLGAFRMTVTAYRCRCGHVWVPRVFKATERPHVCPSCKSANWDEPYQRRRRAKE